MNQNHLQVIDHYEILELVGHGGLSTVYKARDTRLARLVALKLIDTPYTKDVEYQARFLAMAHRLTKLEHPHIVRVVDAGLQDNDLFLAMEYVEGETLRHSLNNQLANGEFLDLREIVTICRQVAQALAYAHEKSVIHHDVKPDNVLLQITTDPKTPNLVGLKAMLGDFGLAKRVNSASIETLNNTQVLNGTLAYMAPELFRQSEVDTRIDIYAFGVMLYELVTGRLPFNSPIPSDLVLMHTQGEPERVSDLRPDAPPALISIIHRAMQKNPDDRYETVLEIARELEALEKSIRLITQPPLRMTRTLIPPMSYGPATVYDVLPALDRPAIPVDLLSEGTDDIIVITSFEGKSWRVPFEKPSITVGRDVVCDVSLDDPRVSRQHVRIDRSPEGKVTVTDLSSLNGLYMGDTRIAKGETSEWVSTQSLKVGPYWLTLRLSNSPVSEGRRLVLSSTQTLEADLPSHRASIRLTPAEAVVEPGSTVIVRLEVFNKTPEARYYQIAVKGLMEEWSTILPFALYVPAGLRSERAISLHPPRTAETTSGHYPYSVSVLPKEEDAKPTLLSAMLHVVQYYDYESTVDAVSHGFRISIRNNGNSERYYVIEVREPQNSLVMLPSRVRVLAAPGEISPVEIRVRAKHRPLAGNIQHQPIEIYLRTDGLPPQSKTFEYAVRPLLSWDMLVLFFLGLGLFLMLLRSL
jgi:serine/threonine protein kinase